MSSVGRAHLPVPERRSHTQTGDMGRSGRSHAGGRNGSRTGKCARPTVRDRRGGPDIALDIWVTQEQEALKGECLLRNLSLFHNPDTPSSVWATPPG